MSFRSRSKEFLQVDNVVLVLLFILAITFGYLSFSPATLTQAPRHGKKIATIGDVESSVKRRASDSLAWDDATRGGDLYAGDQIFTDKKSEAQVKFGDGSEIKVAENSLVRIERQGDKTTLDMSKGFVSGKFGDGNGNVTIKMGGTQVKLEKGAEVQIRVDPNDKGATKVSLLSGNAAVQSASGQVALGKDQVLSVDAKGGTAVRDVSLRPILPAAGASVDGNDGGVFFKWEAKGSGLSFTLLLARDADFHEVVARQGTSNQAFTLTAPEAGAYYWKVQSIDVNGRKDETVVSQLTVVRLAPPELLAPLAGRRFELDASAKNPAVQFLWRGASPKGFDLEVSRDGDFASPLLRKTLADTSLETRELAEGDYFWRVRATSAEAGRKSAWSPVGDFKVARALPAPAPQLAQPDDGGRVKPGTPVTFRWSDVAVASGYRLEISRTADFARPELATNVGGTSYLWTPEAAGTRYWRVASVDRGGLKTEPSPSRTLAVDQQAPVLVEPEDGALITLARKDFTVEFAWTADSGANGDFALELAKDPAFNDVMLRQRLTKTQFRWTKPTVGVFYWRVKAGVAGGKAAAVSGMRKLELRDLELLPPPVLRDKYYFRIPVPNPGSAALPSRGENGLAGDTGTAAAGDRAAGGAVPPAAGYRAAGGAVPPAAGYRAAGGAVPPAAGYRAAGGAEAAAARPLPPVLRSSPILHFLRELLVSSAFAQEATDDANERVLVTWKPIPAANEYVVEVATDQGFTQPVLKRKAKATTFYWPDARPGRYWLRAASVDTRDQVGPFSKPVELVVNFKAPRLYEPANGSTLTPEGSDAVVDFTWQMAPGAPRYVLEVARTQDFAKPVVVKPVTTGTYSVKAGLLAAGSYWWRVRAQYRPGLPEEVAAPWRFLVKPTPLAAPELTEPLAGSVLPADEAKLPVGVAWTEVKGAGDYLVEVARGDGMTDVVSSVTTKQATVDTQLAPGTYHVRVTARAAHAAPGTGSPSAVRDFTVKARLPAPLVTAPKDAETFYQVGNKPVSVSAHWQEVAGAASGYEMQVTAGKDFAKSLKSVQTPAGPGGIAALNLPRGAYRLRVRAQAVDGMAGKWSEPRPFRVVNPDIEAPDLVYPPDGDHLGKVKTVRLTWAKELGYDGYRIVLSRDPDFEDVVTDRSTPATSDNSTVKLPGTGQYYWYVEGRNKEKRYAMRSDIQSFNVSTYAPAGYDKLRLVAAFAPSVVENTMVSSTVNSSLAVAATNSFLLNGQYWLLKPLGIEADFWRKSATLFANAATLGGSTDQQPLPFTPETLNLRFKARMLLGEGAQSPEVFARLGYMYKTFFTYYAASRTALGLTEIGAHHVTVGLGGKLPLALDKYLEAAIDLATPLKSSPSSVKSGSYLNLDLGYFLQYPGNLTAGFGLRYANATYQFEDIPHGVDGTLSETSYSLLGSIGLGI